MFSTIPDENYAFQNRKKSPFGRAKQANVSTLDAPDHRYFDPVAAGYRAAIAR
jgi:hypothetical protein